MVIFSIVMVLAAFLVLVTINFGKNPLDQKAGNYLQTFVLASPVLWYFLGTPFTRFLFMAAALAAGVCGVIHFFDPADERKGTEAGPIARSNDRTELNMIPDNAFETLKCPSCGGSVRPTAKQCVYCGSTLVPRIELPEPAKLDQFQVGQGMKIAAEGREPVAGTILSRILFSELWQASRGPDVPWTDTGNHYAGFILDGGLYLLNWQDRFYVLTGSKAVNDQMIARDFGPHARKFGASDQQARVEFDFDGRRWRMDDIGRFHIKYVEGDKAQFKKDAVGRFIHASSGQEALIVEDYQSGGGGRDLAWRGYRVQENEIS